MIHQTIFYTVRSSTFKTAQQKFVSSMAAYSMICYLLQVSALAVFATAAAFAAAADLPQIKDRHDGNILIKRDGRCARACAVNTE
jgi:phosphatidylinositol kinase/protein kinase (PI-3  family)